MQGRSSLESNSDSGSAPGSDDYGSGRSIPGSDSDYTEPGTPVDLHHPVEVALYSPSRSLDEDQGYAVTLPKSISREDYSRRSLAISPSSGPTSADIMPQFLKLIRSPDLCEGDEYRLSKYFTQIRNLQLEWQNAGCEGWVTKDITDGMNEQLYELMQKKVDASWQWELGEGEYRRWLLFIRCMRIDFWPKLEDMAYSMTKRFGNVFKESELDPIHSTLTIPSDMVVKAPDVHFRFRYNAVVKEAGGDTASTPFFC
ncbi:uncharacterized protein B0H18DRAFT_962555, partial [Fomitopsis serialis]|uniref:uncharacterized protein n=1 Tax=Fomitopsis serialis TaxID=139415 RepID=UPI0020075482